MGWQIPLSSSAGCHLAMLHCKELLSCCSGASAALRMSSDFRLLVAESRVDDVFLPAYRHLQQRHDAVSTDSSHRVSNSAAAGLCSLFRAHARSCCLSLSQILGKQEQQLVSAVCTFLHQHLLAPSVDQVPDSDPDLESCDSDRPSLVQEAFEHPQLVQDVTLSAQGLSGWSLLWPDCLNAWS